MHESICLDYHSNQHLRRIWLLQSVSFGMFETEPIMRNLEARALTPVFSEWDGNSTMHTLCTTSSFSESALEGAQCSDNMFINFDAPQEYFILQKLKHWDKIDFEHHILDKENDIKPGSLTSSLSWSSIGVLLIGENPRAGMPNCLTNRESVVEDKISGLDSFPPAEVIACSNTDHHGFDSSVAVNMGRPAPSVTGPFCVSCMNNNGFQEIKKLVYFSYPNDSETNFHLIGQVFMSWCPFLFDSSFYLFNVCSWGKAKIKANLCFWRLHIHHKTLHQSVFSDYRSH